MNLAPIATAIKAACPLFKVVGGMAEFDLAADGVKATPSAFVVPLSERAGENEQIDGYFQRVEVDFGVCIAVKQARGPEEALVDLETLRDSVLAAINGENVFTDPLTEAVRYTGGQLLDFQPGLMWWQDSYQVVSYIQST